jgi:hypothetical protein
MVILLPPVAEPALASALPRRRALRDHPCQGTTVRDLFALRAGLSRAATLHLRPRMPEPRASLARIALLLTRLKPPCTSLLAPGCSPPLESCSCTHTLTPPASVPCLLQPCCVVPAHPRSSAHSAPPRTCCSTRAPASPAFAPALATPESTRCFHCAALQLLFAQRPRTSAVCSPEAVGFAPALGSRAPPARTQLPCTSSPVALARSASARSAAPLALALPPRRAPPAPVRHRAHAIALRCSLLRTPSRTPPTRPHLRAPHSRLRHSGRASAVCDVLLLGPPCTHLPSSTPAASATPEPPLLRSPPCVNSGRRVPLAAARLPLHFPTEPPAMPPEAAPRRSCGHRSGPTPALAALAPVRATPAHGPRVPAPHLGPLPTPRLGRAPPLGPPSAAPPAPLRARSRLRSLAPSTCAPSRARRPAPSARVGPPPPQAPAAASAWLPCAICLGRREREKMVEIRMGNGTVLPVGERDKGARDKETEEKGKRDFPRTYA